MQERPNAALGPKTAWMGNVGRPGHTPHRHVLEVEKLLRRHSEIDAVVLLIGVNDMLIHLALATYLPPGSSGWAETRDSIAELQVAVVT